MIKNILFATDGSASAERAADLAASLAVRYEAKITVLHAFTPVPGYLGEPNYSKALYETLEDAASLVENIAMRLREKGVAEVDTEAMEDSPASAILRMAEIRKPGLIVMGARGLGIWKGIFLGSVSMAVTQRAECPVLIVK